MKNTISDIFEQIKKNMVIRHLQQRGDQIHFSLYGNDCVFIFRNDYYYLGARLTKSKADKLSIKQLSEIMLVLVENVDDVELNLFVSEKGFPFIFTRLHADVFAVGSYEKEFERLLVVNSILKKLLSSQLPHKPSKPGIKESWIPM